MWQIIFETGHLTIKKVMEFIPYILIITESIGPFISRDIYMIYSLENGKGGENILSRVLVRRNF